MCIVATSNFPSLIPSPVCRSPVKYCYLVFSITDMTRGRGRASAGHADKSSVRKRKRLAVEKSRDPTPSAKHLRVHTHGHAANSFVGEQSRIVHERSQEILQPQTQAHSDTDDQCQAYYQAAGGENKRRVYSLESQAKSYHGPNLHTSSGSDATSPATLLNVQSTPIGNLLLNVQSTPVGNVEELVMQLIPILMDHMRPIFVEGVRRAISSPPNTHTDHPSVVAPTVPAAPTTANIDKVHASVSDDDGNSTASH